MICPVFYFVGENVGVNLTTASESGTIIACIPIASLIASALLLKKKPTKMQVAGVCISMIGVLITVLGMGMSASLSVPGYLMLFLAVVMYAWYCVRVDRAPEFTGGELTYAMLGVGCAVFVPAAIAESLIKGTVHELVTAPFTSASLMKAVIYQSLGCSIAAFFMSNVALAYVGVNRMASFVGLSTVVSILTGVMVLGESFTTFQIIGAVVIVGGVYIANARKKNTDINSAGRDNSR